MRHLIYCDDIDWYLNERDASCGVKSSIGGQISTIERGGSHGSANTDPYDENQLGWGSRYGRDAPTLGHFERDRVMLRLWARLDEAQKRMHLAHYTIKMPTYGLDKDGKEWGFRAWPVNVSSIFGKFCGAALYLAHQSGDLAKVLKACEDNNRNARVIVGLEPRAREAVIAAHQHFYAVRDAAYEEWAA